MSQGLFNGWGIRTLSSANTGYNPISYHCGSVWPHDNALCAAGLMRYGFVEEAHRVMRGLVEAAPWFGDLLPELFGGMSRDRLGFPVSYPTSCSPQAWAAASPLLFLRTLLRFEPDIRRSSLHLAPRCPTGSEPCASSASRSWVGIWASRCRARSCVWSTCPKA